MNKKDEKLKRELITTSKAVKRKYRALKLGQAEENVRREETFKPLIEPLKEIVRQSKKPIKQDIKIEKNEAVTTPKPPPKPQPSFLTTEAVAESTPLIDEDEIPSLQSLRESVTNVDKTVIKDFLEQYESLPRQYVEKLITDDDREIDYTFGMHYDQTNDSWSLGNTPIQIVGSDIVINNVTYKGTPGLYELIFMKIPTGYNREDSSTYKKILEQTNLYKHRFDPQGRVKSNKGYKYLHIVKPIIEGSPKSSSATKKARRLKSWDGEGMFYSEKPLEYVYWNHPAELVGRLRLLWASKMAGNSNHNNEIQSIVEELREEDVIY